MDLNSELVDSQSMMGPDSFAASPRLSSTPKSKTLRGKYEEWKSTNIHFQSRSPYPIRSRPSNNLTNSKPKQDKLQYLLQEVASLKLEMIALCQQHQTKRDAMRAEIAELRQAYSRPSNPNTPSTTNPPDLNSQSDKPETISNRPEPIKIKKKRKKKKINRRLPAPQDQKENDSVASAVQRLGSFVNRCEKLQKELTSQTNRLLNNYSHFILPITPLIPYFPNPPTPFLIPQALP